MSLYPKERDMAIHAVTQASHLCKKIRHRLVSEETVIKKDRSPVTIADFSSQAVISSFLRNTFPDDPLVAEECADDLQELGDASLVQRVLESVQTVLPDTDEDATVSLLNHGRHPGGKSGRFWTLDPIDGTKGFLRNEQYAVSLALIEEGEVVLGVLGCPNFPAGWDQPDQGSGYLFIASKGEGAFIRPLDGEEETPISVTAIDDVSKAIFCESVESGHSLHGHSQKIAHRLGVTQAPLRIDSQCKYAAVARADASIYLRLPTRADYQEKIWDHAAGVIVLQEAGGHVTDIHGHRLDFSNGRTLSNNQGVIATNGRFHDTVVAAVQAILF